jgi:CBS domain-containing protein
MSERKVIRVRDVMKEKFDMVDGLTSVSAALQKMRHVETKCVLVDKRHDDDVFGMLLLSDVARQVLGKDRAPERVNVYEIMTKPVLTVSPEMDIRYCARLFEQFGLSRAPVEQGGKIIGIVSLTDMVLNGLCASL